MHSFDKSIAYTIEWIQLLCPCRYIDRPGKVKTAVHGACGAVEKDTNKISWRTPLEMPNSLREIGTGIPHFLGRCRKPGGQIVLYQVFPPPPQKARLS